MAKRQRYKEKISRMLYEHTSLNKTALTMQKSWQEADKALEAIKKQFQGKSGKKGKTEKEEGV